MATILPGRPTLRLFGTLLGVLAILAQTVALVGHRPAMAMDAAKASAEAGSPAAHHHDSRPAAPAPAHHDSPTHCPICLALHLLGGFVPPVGSTLAAGPAEPVVLWRAEAATTALGGHIAGGSRPRAPPDVAT